MKKFIVTMLMFVFAISVANPAFAKGPLYSKSGYQDFDALAEIVGSNLYVIVWNQSTDDSRGSDRCKTGMASVVVDVELWHPDAGQVSRAKIDFLDVCNGEVMGYVAIPGIPSQYDRLEVRYNLTTPDGEHSFEKGSSNWRR